MPSVSFDAAADTVPIPLTVAVWSQAVFRRAIAPGAIVAAILADPRASHLCYGLAGVDDETLQYLVDHPDVITQLYEHDAAAFAAFGDSLHVHANRVVPPGGPDAVALWGAAVGETPDRPGPFIGALFGLQEGRLAYLYDTIGQLDAPRAAFALGLWIKDPARRVKRFKALAEANRTAFPQWRPAKLPFTRPVHDVGSMLSRVQAEPDGSPSFPALRSWWTWAFESADLPPAAAQVADTVADDGPVDAAWLAQAIVSADTSGRRERLDQFAFGQRTFGTADPSTMPDVLIAIRAFPRYRMLMLTLERIGVRDAAVYTSAARRAQELARVDGRQGIRGARSVPGRPGAGRADGERADARSRHDRITDHQSLRRTAGPRRMVCRSDRDMDAAGSPRGPHAGHGAGRTGHHGRHSVLGTGRSPCRDPAGDVDDSLGRAAISTRSGRFGGAAAPARPRETGKLFSRSGTRSPGRLQQAHGGSPCAERHPSGRRGPESSRAVVCSQKGERGVGSIVDRAGWSA